MENFLKLFETNKMDILTTLIRESGKNPGQGIFEYNFVNIVLPSYFETAKRYVGEIIPPGADAGTDSNLMMITHEPLGTIAAIVPFNASVMLMMWKVAPALAAGNAVIVKPSTDNPLAVIKVCDLMLKAGVPGNTLQVVTGRGNEVGAWLTGHHGIDGITMTGSTQAGLTIAQTAAKRLAPCALELGGNDAFILLPDGNIEQAVAEAAFTRTDNCGQVCCSPKRFLIHNAIKDVFIDKLTNLLGTLTQGYDDNVEEALEILFQGGEYNNMIPCLISEKAAIEVKRQIDLTVEQGASIVCGGKRKGAFVSPTILDGVTKEMDVAQSMEIFGPVFPIIGFDTIEEAIAITNNSTYGLSGSIYTSDWKMAMKIARSIETGSVHVNGPGIQRFFMQPFGGYKLSGVGREDVWTIKEMTQEKFISLQGFLDKF